MDSADTKQFQRFLNGRDDFIDKIVQNGTAEKFGQWPGLKSNALAIRISKIVLSPLITSASKAKNICSYKKNNANA